VRVNINDSKTSSRNIQALNRKGFFCEIAVTLSNEKKFLDIVEKFRELRANQYFRDALDYSYNMKPIILKLLLDLGEDEEKCENLFSALVVLFSTYPPDQVSKLSKRELCAPVEEYDKYMRLDMGYPPVFGITVTELQ